MTEQVVYLERSMIILESSEESMSVFLAKAEVTGLHPLKEIMGE